MKEIYKAVGLGAWASSVVSVFLTRNLVPEDSFLDVLSKAGGLTLVVVGAIYFLGVIAKKLNK